MFIFWCFNVDSSVKTSSFKSKHVAQSDRLILSSHQNTDVFRMILNSFIHITDTKRNITTKDLESCYKRYSAYWCSDNSGITNCTTATVTTVELRTAQQLQWQQIYKNFLGLSTKFTWNGTRIASYRLLQIIIYKTLQYLSNYGIVQ